jgi:two-component system response regulator YesN
MKRRILIIEDEKPLREAFAFLLESEGYDICLAENGKVGLRMLKDFKPHLVILDMLMPIMNGLDFLKAAKLERAPHIKTLMLSNLSDPIGIDDASHFGVTDSVLKADLSPADLAAKVKKLLLQP